MYSSDHDCTRPSLFALLDEICISQAFLCVGKPELLRKVIITDATGENDRVGWEDIL